MPSVEHLKTPLFFSLFNECGISPGLRLTPSLLCPPSFPLRLPQVRPVRVLPRLPDAAAGAVRGVALPQRGGLLRFAAHREDGVHRVHGVRLQRLHAPQRGRAGLPGRQGRH